MSHTPYEPRLTSIWQWTGRVRIHSVLLRLGEIDGMFDGMKTLDATKMAESFPRFLGQVVSRRESFKIVKEGVPCAYLLPIGKTQSGSHELADDIAEAELNPSDRRALASAIAKGRKALKPLKNPWG